MCKKRNDEYQIDLTEYELKILHGALNIHEIPRMYRFLSDEGRLWSVSERKQFREEQDALLRVHEKLRKELTKISDWYKRDYED